MITRFLLQRAFVCLCEQEEQASIRDFGKSTQQVLRAF